MISVNKDSLYFRYRVKIDRLVRVSNGLWGFGGTLFSADFEWATHSRDSAVSRVGPMFAINMRYLRSQWDAAVRVHTLPWPSSFVSRASPKTKTARWLAKQERRGEEVPRERKIVERRSSRTERRAIPTGDQFLEIRKSSSFANFREFSCFSCILFFHFIFLVRCFIYKSFWAVALFFP